MAALNTSARFVKRRVWDTQVRLVLAIAIGVGLGWLAVRGIEWGLVVDQFQDFPIGWAFASLALFLLASLIRAYRWQVLFVRQKLPLAQLFMVQNAGIGLNNLVPVRVLSEGAQFALLTVRYGVKGGTALATLGMERILDLVVTASLLMTGLTLLPNKGDFLPYVVGVFVVAVASVLAVPFVIWISNKRFLNRIRLLVSTADSLSDLSRARFTLGYSFLLTLAYWLLIGLCAWILAHGMDLGISPFVATLAILGTLYFATSLPALPAAVGTFEFAIVYVLKFSEVPQELAFSYGLMMHAILFIPPIIIAMVVLPAIGLKPLKAGRYVKPLEQSGTLSGNNQERNPE